jgi:hypothetical protein
MTMILPVIVEINIEIIGYGLDVIERSHFCNMATFLCRGTFTFAPWTKEDAGWVSSQVGSNKDLCAASLIW